MELSIRIIRIKTTCDINFDGIVVPPFLTISVGGTAQFDAHKMISNCKMNASASQEI